MLYVIGIAYARAYHVLTNFRYVREMENAFQLQQMSQQIANYERHVNDIHH